MEAAKAKSFVAPVYVTVSLAGALAIVGGIVLGQERRAPAEAPATNVVAAETK